MIDGCCGEQQTVRRRLVWSGLLVTVAVEARQIRSSTIWIAPIKLVLGALTNIPDIIHSRRIRVST